MNIEASNESGSGDLDDDYYYNLPDCGKYVCSFFTLTTLIPLTVIFLIVMVIGIIGNTITILIVRRYKEMKTTTNFYLSSMAVSDMIILLCLPFDLYRLWKSRPWILGGFLCKFLHYASEGCTYSTILHITALSIERYLAICFPLKAKVFVTKRRVKVVIGALWVFAMLSAGPFYFLMDEIRANLTNSSEDSIECRYTPHAMKSGLLDIMMWVTTVFFFFPMFCLTILYGFIGKKLWKSKDELRGPNAAHREKCHRQTVRILVVVVLAFIICWLPFHMGRIIFVSTEDIRTMVFSQYFNLVAMQLFYLSASINPILYNVISKKYRAAAYKLLMSRSSEKRAYNVISEYTVGSTEISTCIQSEYATHSRRSRHQPFTSPENGPRNLLYFLKPFPKRNCDSASLSSPQNQPI
ncbi:motilin receptor [Pelobates cultripes]|uniref:Growth hormone secretagogue receptor type 1 n=1 Tax=Pelobates cultripes TaxID=61616 RepID=A0AAD1R6J4_PELCU|nr:motilin receptor [Pelobates cultripes]